MAGYQLIEPRVLGDMYRGDMAFAVAVLHWLREQVRAELGEQLDGAQVEVIVAEYHGAYPTLAVRYERECEDLGPAIEAAVERLLRERPVLELVEFISRGSRD